MRVFHLACGAALGAALACACGSTTATPTFTEIYGDTIATKCAPCHTTANGDGVLSGKLDMTSRAAAYANLVGQPAAGDACAGKGTRVAPGSAKDSVFYLKLSPGDAPPCGEKMPLGGAPLDSEESDGIAAWINAGAPND